MFGPNKICLALAVDRLLCVCGLGGGGAHTAYFAYHVNSVVKYLCFCSHILIPRIPKHTSVNDCILCIPRVNDAYLAYPTFLPPFSRGQKKY